MCCCFSASTGEARKLQRLLNKGKQGIEKSLNIETIIRNLKNLKIIIKDRFFTEEIRYKVQHDQKNIIDIDTSEEEGEEREEAENGAEESKELESS